MKILEKGLWGTIKEKHSAVGASLLDDSDNVIIIEDVEIDPFMVRLGYPDEIDIFMINGMRYLKLDADLCGDLQSLCGALEDENAAEEDDDD